jgi:hypothetical protein
MDPLAYRDVLLTIAQVAAAFVGFSMVVAAIQSRSSHSGARFSAIRDVAEIGLYVIAGALLPIGAYAFDLDPDGLATFKRRRWHAVDSRLHLRADPVSAKRCGARVGQALSDLGRNGDRVRIVGQHSALVERIGSGGPHGRSLPFGAPAMAFDCGWSFHQCDIPRTKPITSG